MLDQFPHKSDMPVTVAHLGVVTSDNTGDAADRTALYSTKQWIQASTQSLQNRLHTETNHAFSGLFRDVYHLGISGRVVFHRGSDDFLGNLISLLLTKLDMCCTRELCFW